MSDPFIGEIRPFAATYYPGDGNWLPCDGRSVPVTQYQALYGVIGNTYGTPGNPSVFVLPNLNAAAGQVGIALLGAGQAAQGSNYPVGTNTGAPSVQLSLAQTPAHNHTITGINTAAGGTYPAPTTASHLSRLQTSSSATEYAYSDQAAAGYLANTALTPAGTPSPAAHDNMQPYVAVLYAIACNGMFPAKP